MFSNFVSPLVISDGKIKILLDPIIPPGYLMVRPLLYFVSRSVVLEVRQSIACSAVADIICV